MTSEGARASARKRKTPEAKLRQDAQKLTKLAMETLAAIMRGDGQDAVRLAAAREVLDRGHGKPKAGELPAADGEGMTVIIQRLTDPPEAVGSDAQ